MYYAIGASVSALHRESTDSLIQSCIVSIKIHAREVFESVFCSAAPV